MIRRMILAGAVAAMLVSTGGSPAQADHEMIPESSGCGAPRFYPPLAGGSGPLPDSHPVRGPAGALFGRTLGTVRSQLAWWEVPMSAGTRVLVHSRLLPVLHDVGSNLAAESASGRHYRVRSSDTYGFEPRTSIAHQGISYHALGAAIDVNASTNPYRSDNRLITDMPAWFIEAWESAGMCWGGNWVGVKDTMHFSWMGPGASPAYDVIPAPFRPLTYPSGFERQAGNHDVVFPVGVDIQAVVEASGDGAPDVARIRPWGEDDAVLELLTSRSGLRSCGLWRWWLEDPPSGEPTFADLDGVGRPDLVYLDEKDGRVVVHRYAVADGYERTDDITTGIPFGAGDRHVFGDVDGDGIDDLWIVGPGADPEVSVWKGDGGFTVPLAGGRLEGVDMSTATLGSADRDVDGDEELAVAIPEGAESKVYFFDEGLGTPVETTVGPAIGAGDELAWEDYDGDGRPDMGVLSGGSLSIFLGNEPLPGVAATSWFLPADYECPDDAVPYFHEGPFADDEDSLFVDDIEWLAGTGITRGCNPPFQDRFCSDERVTRGQMAAFLNRALGLAPAANGFIDDDGSVFEADIGALAAAGITRGCNPTANSDDGPPPDPRFCPDDPVTRGQMAAFLNRALGLAPAANGFTDDDDSVFEADIGALAAAGITRGCNPPSQDRYCPDDPITRGQMAAFLHRARELLP